MRSYLLEVLLDFRHSLGDVLAVERYAGRVDLAHRNIFAAHETDEFGYSFY